MIGKRRKREDRSAELATLAQREFLKWSLVFSAGGAGFFLLMLALARDNFLDWDAWSAIGQVGAFVFGLAVAFAGSFVAVKLAAAALRISEEAQKMTTRSFEAGSAPRYMRCWTISVVSPQRFAFGGPSPTS